MDTTKPSSVPQGEVDLLAIGAVLLRRRRLIVGIPLALCVTLGVIVLLQPRTYTTKLAFAPSSSENSASRFAGVAAQFGINIGAGAGGDAAANPDLYVDLIRSEQFLRALAESRFWHPGTTGDTVRGTLVDFYEIDAPTDDARLAAAVRQLANDISAGTGLKSGLVNLSAQSKWPDLSLQMTNRALELVNQFGIANRQTRATAEARFTQEQLSEAQQALGSAEDAQRDFLTRNRNYSSSPALTLEFGRLQRRVSIQEQVFAALAQSLAQARLDEFRNTPVISVVEPPLLAIAPDRRGLILKEIAMGLFGLGVALGIALWLEHWRRLGLSTPGSAAALRNEWARCRDEVRGWLGRWRRDG